MPNKFVENCELLVIKGKEYYGAKIELSSPQLTIGRDPGICNLVFNQNLISRLHCRLFMYGDKLYLKNHSPINGTYYNGNKLEDKEKVLLSINDKIDLAHCQTLQIVSLNQKTIMPDDLPQPTQTIAINQETHPDWKSMIFG